MMEKAMIGLDDFQELMRRVEQARRERDQELGAIRQRKTRLKEEYGAETLAEAKELREKAHRRMMKRADACLVAKKAFEAALAAKPKGAT